MDELFEALTLIKTKKIARFPVFLVGTTYWKDLLTWLKNIPLEHKYIDPDDFKLITLTDDLDEVVKGIINHCEETKCQVNF